MDDRNRLATGAAVGQFQKEKGHPENQGARLATLVYASGTIAAFFLAPYAFSLPSSVAWAEADAAAAVEAEDAPRAVAFVVADDPREAGSAAVIVAAPAVAEVPLDARSAAPDDSAAALQADGRFAEAAQVNGSAPDG